MKENGKEKARPGKGGGQREKTGESCGLEQKSRAKTISPAFAMPTRIGGPVFCYTGVSSPFSMRKTESACCTRDVSWVTMTSVIPISFRV